MHYFKWLCVLMVLSCVGRTSHCKSVAMLELIKRMDHCNPSQCTVDKSEPWQLYGAHSVKGDKPLAAVHTDKGWVQMSAAKYRNANLGTNDIQNEHKWRGQQCFSISLSIYLSIYPSLHLSIYLSTDNNGVSTKSCCVMKNLYFSLYIHYPTIKYLRQSRTTTLASWFLDPTWKYLR